MAEHKDTLGAPLCPCRHYEDKEAEVKNGFWNCPCVPMRERKECHCMLFLTEDNPFQNGDATISLEDISREVEGGGPERCTSRSPNRAACLLRIGRNVCTEHLSGRISRIRKK